VLHNLSLGCPVRFTGNLQAEELVGLDVDHRMDFDPTAPDLPLLPHPLAPVRDLDPGTVDGDDDVLGEDLGCHVEWEIQEGEPGRPVFGGRGWCSRLP